MLKIGNRLKGQSENKKEGEDKIQESGVEVETQLTNTETKYLSDMTSCFIFETWHDIMRHGMRS